ncbi:MAG: hypothetical protein OMOMHJEC_00854 [Xanthomonadales bacterium]|nr:hypothetical protein [Xanthomonadales bacterium]
MSGSPFNQRFNVFVVGGHNSPGRSIDDDFHIGINTGKFRSRLERNDRLLEFVPYQFVVAIEELDEFS